MVNHSVKFYISSDEERRLINKAKDSGFTGRGATSHYISKIANEPVAFLDDELKKKLKGEEKEDA